jgi:hypothetical protein
MYDKEILSYIELFTNNILDKLFILYKIKIDIHNKSSDNNNIEILFNYKDNFISSEELSQKGKNVIEFIIKILIFKMNYVYDSNILLINNAVMFCNLDTNEITTMMDFCLSNVNNIIMYGTVAN